MNKCRIQALDEYDEEIADWGKLPKVPLVSVKMITYQHAKYIHQALDSVLKQKTNFCIEFCIGEDGSTDGTREICIEYARKHPELIRLFLRNRKNPKRKKYASPMGYNGINTLHSCRGKYIAFCEGDDYWTDPYKLQKQVDYLEANPDCSICTHWVKTKKGNDEPFDEELVSGRIRPPFIKSEDMFLERGKDKLIGLHFMTLSFVARKECFKFKNKILSKIPAGDNAIWINALERGHAYCIPEYMGIYRKHQNSTWSSLSSTKKNIQMIVNWLYIKCYFPKYSTRILNLLGRELIAWKDWDCSLIVYKDFTKSIFYFIGRHPLFSVTLFEFFFLVSISYFYRNLRCITKQSFGLLRSKFIKKII